MTLLILFCVLAAAFMPIACAGVAKWGAMRQPRREGGYDNDLPRQWLAQQTGLRARANAAQANCFEALPFFVGAVAIALSLGADHGRLGWLAAAWVVVRLAYVAAYLGNAATVRSLIWMAGLGLNVAILFAALR